jgi:hypothetical protein
VHETLTALKAQAAAGVDVSLRAAPWGSRERRFPDPPIAGISPAAANTRRDGANVAAAAASADTQKALLFMCLLLITAALEGDATSSGSRAVRREVVLIQQ